MKENGSQQRDMLRERPVTTIAYGILYGCVMVAFVGFLVWIVVAALAQMLG